jgi:DedD protein
MGLFSSKNKRDRALDDSGRFYSKDDDAAVGERARSKRASNAGAGARRSANDPMLPEKKRARRRLVGAIALALAAAVGVPMLLDSSPKPLAGDIAIDIPSKDKAPALPAPAAPGDADASGAGAVAPASTPAASPAAPAASPAIPRNRSVSAADSIDKGEEVIAAPPAAKPEARKPEPKPQAVAELPRAEHKEPKPEHKDLAKPEHKDVKAEAHLADKADKADKAEKAAKPAKTHDDAARALAILEGKGAAKPDAAASQKSVLQVAAMSSAEKAAEVQARLREAGISSYTEKSASGLIRVKVAFDKDEADKVRAKLAKLGL